MAIPVVDIFAGPGGLGEGFSALFENGERVFKTVLSIEMDEYAHQTLTLRSFYRQFDPNQVPGDYYEVLRNNLTVDELFERWPNEAAAATNEAWKAKLGYDDKSAEAEVVDQRISEAIGDRDDWILIGGPPCQAYSVVGRSRRQQKMLNAEEDERVDLYKQYLRILAVHNPAVFVMENVKGLLSAKSNTNPIFKKILHDLKDPKNTVTDISEEKKRELECPGYKIYSLVKEPRNNLFEDEPEYEPQDFVIRSEEYGIPQTRHRVIILGIRKDIDAKPEILQKQDKISIEKVINDLPRLRSALSRQKNTWKNWSYKVGELILNGALEEIDSQVTKVIRVAVKGLRNPHKDSGDEFVESRVDAKSVQYAREWFEDKEIGGACNHESRGHMGSDLHRYLFSAAFAKVNQRSPKLEDFPRSLLPDHKNVNEAIKTKKFADRFRVQLADKPSKTITSHISKDGHYYIHPDPTQCRSLTVREAARIQTFPDNYFFCGPRTSQYVQVGNAVPPLLAYNIAAIVMGILN